METQIVTLFCIIVDFLNAIDFKDDSQVQMSTAEVMLTTIVAAKFFTGNIEISRMFLRDHKYVQQMLSKSRFNRRADQINMAIWEALQGFLREILMLRILKNSTQWIVFLCLSAKILELAVVKFIKKSNTEVLTQVIKYIFLD